MTEFHVPEKYYMPEKREGFLVGEMMKRCWAAQMQALVEIEQVCIDNSVRFFAAYGTLLGAVRHKGFIPWDDDIDIGMLRDDYVRFLELFPEKSGEYQIYNPYTKPWFCMNFSHVVNGGDLCFEEKYLRRWHGCPFLIGPDVFPYYYLPRSKDDEKWVIWVLGRIDEAVAMSRKSSAESDKKGRFDMDARLNEELAKRLVELQRETGFEFDTLRPLDNQLEILYDQVCRLTERSEADYAVRYDEYCADRQKRMSIEWLENCDTLPFENISIPVPKDYRAVLEVTFGTDYMIPKQVPGDHGYPFYRRQLEGMGNYIEKKENEIYKVENAEISAVNDGCKIVLFHTSIRDMLVDSAYAINKIADVLDFFRGRSTEYLLWWVPGRFYHTEEMALDEIVPYLVKDYEKMISACRGEDFVICDFSGDVSKAAEKCDIYYGDSGMLAEECERIGRRVVIQDYKTRDMESVL